MSLRVPRVITRRQRGAYSMTAGEYEEAMACSPSRGVEGFTRFCARHVVIEDKEAGGECNLAFWPGQARVVPHLVNWDWLTGLKGRQVGFTTLLKPYVLWRARWMRAFRCGVMLQDLHYSWLFVDGIRSIWRALPRFLQPPIVIDNDRLLRFAVGGRMADVHIFAGGGKGGRSITGDLAIFDEAGFMERFGKSLAATIPAFRRLRTDTRGGQIIVSSTSDGPESEYHQHWQETYGDAGELLNAEGRGPTGFRPVFIGWWERPGRTREWYEEEKKRLDKISPVEIKREHPNSPEEAFEHAAGRVYGLFSRHRNVGEITIPDTAYRCRAIDWGESKSAYVVLWIAYIPGPPGFLVHPDCVDTIREFIQYRLDDKGRPEKQNDHCPDAVRYAVTHHNMRGLVYVYREVYRTDAVSTGWSPDRDVAEIHELSGWERAGPRSRRKWQPTKRAEKYDLCLVADRSMGKLIAHLNENQIPAEGNKPFDPQIVGGSKRHDRPDSERVEGIRLVASLIAGTEDLDHFYQIDRGQELVREVKAMKHKPALTLEEARMMQLAKRIVDRNRRRR